MNSFPFDAISFPLPTFPWKWLTFGNYKSSLKPLKNLSFVATKDISISKTSFRRKNPGEPQKIRYFPVSIFSICNIHMNMEMEFHIHILFTFFGKGV